MSNPNRIGRQDDTRTEPRWAALTERIRQGCVSRGLLYDDEPAWRQIGPKAGLSATTVYAIRDRTSWPSRRTIIKLATYFGDGAALAGWLYDAGLETAPPPMPEMTADERDWVNLLRSYKRYRQPSPQALRDQMQAVRAMWQLPEAEESC